MTVAAATAMVLVALPGFRLAGGPLGSARQPTPVARSGPGFACMYEDDGRDDAQHAQDCRRAASDHEQRSSAPSAKPLLRASAHDVLAAVLTSLQCPDPQRPCSTALHAPTMADVDAVRRGLRTAGYATVTVRLATDADPAPSGSLLYAVATGGTCIVGHLEQTPGGASRQDVTGPLPTGACLP
jgi:hypothetical protein